MKKHLRIIAISLSLFLCYLKLHAQWVNIPDANFRAWLNANGYSQCMNGNLMDTTCNAVVTDTLIFCGGENISSLDGIQYFDALINLQCPSNPLTTLPALPRNLKYFDCYEHELTTLPTLPSRLRHLTCGAGLLTSLPTLPDSLYYLDCEFNQLFSLPVLPASLRTLWCNGNGITVLPQLPIALTNLWCVSNAITSLPVLPDSLIDLNCGGNFLTSLPTLPESLRSLYCQYNQLTSLPQLPLHLNDLACNNNQLASLPALPDSLYSIQCWTNQLISLPDLPDSVHTLYCYDNPGLTCFPPLKEVTTLRFDLTSINCVPNYPQSNIYSYPSLDTVPVCDLFNINQCALTYNISGKVYVDSLADCVRDSVEYGVNNVQVKLFENGNLTQQTSAYYQGRYTFSTNFSTYEYRVDTANLPFELVCPDTGYYTSEITAFSSLHIDKDFGLRCKAGFDLKAKSIIGLFIPAYARKISIAAGDASNFYNAHCAAGVSGAVTVTINGSAHYTAPASGALTPTVNGNTLTYTIADFGAVNFFTDFNIMVQTDTTAVLGSQICITVSVTPTAGDNNPANNTLTICFPVVGSYDPNDKTAYPAGDIDTAQKEITYTVRFQNTGTAEAQHIYITDTLSQFIDEGSFQLLAYSHHPMVQIEQNRVRFNFPNINLPDSNTNEPLSHGYVQYKIKLKDNLPIGTQINNTAHIYFDFNAPVVTNTTTNTITTNTAVAEVRSQVLDFRLSPNPTRDAFSVTVPETLVGKMLLVTDATGRAVFQSKISNLKSEISVSNMSPGIYLVRVGNTVQRLVLE